MWEFVSAGVSRMSVAISVTHGISYGRHMVHNGLCEMSRSDPTSGTDL